MFTDYGARHQLVPCRMKFNPIDPVAEAIMCA
jgi:hypothetical protein